jgi:hypothetical protein
VSTPPARPAIGATGLHRHLAEKGITVLAVTADEREPGAFTVYLHGTAGKDHHERAFAVLATVPGVVEVRSSEQTTSILLVRQRPNIPR